MLWHGGMSWVAETDFKETRDQTRSNQAQDLAAPSVLEIHLGRHPRSASKQLYISQFATI